MRVLLSLEGNNMTSEYENMTEKEMNDLILALDGTEGLAAIKKYIVYRETLINNALRSTDPFKNPTEIARNQGIRLGLYDLLEYIELLKRQRKEAEGGEDK